MNAFDRLLIGESPEFKALTRTAQIAALTDVPLMLIGENGSGKSLMAKAVHQHSPRYRGPLIELKCGLTDEQTLEHGWMDARGGTLLLDDLGSLSSDCQTLLLFLLERNPETRERDQQGHVQNVRVITTVTGDLFPQAESGQFRHDLFFRLKVVPLDIPPLKERTGDAIVLFERFSLEFARRYEVERPYLTRPAEQALKRYPWPGNVRELRNLCERLVILFSGKAIDTTNLPRELQSTAPQSAPFCLPESGIRLDDIERDLIQQALTRTIGNRSRAARLLGITRDTLLYRLKKYALE